VLGLVYDGTVLAGAVLHVGRALSQHYQNPGTFAGGTIVGVAVDVSDQAYLDLQKEAARAFSVD
jgi:arylsulfatase